MQQKLSRGCRTALALLMACSLLLVGTVASDADDFDDGIVEDVQVSQFPKKKNKRKKKQQAAMPACIYVHVHMYTYIHTNINTYVCCFEAGGGNRRTKVHVIGIICSRRVSNRPAQGRRRRRRSRSRG